MANDSKSSMRTIGVEVLPKLLLVLIVGVACLSFAYLSNCIDGCGPYHNRSTVADLDGDGDLDVVVSNLRHETKTIVWAGATLWINQGGGRFTPRSGYFGGPYTTAGDVDGDGDVDLLRWGYDVLRIHNNYSKDDPLGDGFRVWYSVHTGDDPLNWSVAPNGGIAIGDLNGDGRLDAVVSKCCATMIRKRDDFLPFLPWVWINKPDEMGYPNRLGMNLNALGDLPMQPTLGDLDGDGDLDLYAASLPPTFGKYDSADRIFWNDGNGAFTDSGQRLKNPRRASVGASGAVALGDLEGDGDLDVVVATARGASIWMNQGGAQGGQMGVFARSAQTLGRGHIEAVFLADLDADGDLEVLMAGNTRVSVWWNDGQANFSDSEQRLKITQRHGLAVGDFDGDGDPDFFSATDNEFQLWLNQGDGWLQAQF